MRYDTVRDTIRYDTIRYDTIRYDSIRYDSIRYGTIRYDTVRYEIRYEIRYDTARYDPIPNDRTRLLILWSPEFIWPCLDKLGPIIIVIADGKAFRLTGSENTTRPQKILLTPFMPKNFTNL